MELYATYTSNAAMETAMLMILGFLLVSCRFQKSHFASTRPLILLAIANMLLLSCQIGQWQVMRLEYLGLLPHVIAIKKLLYSSDYMLYYAVSVCYYYYIIVYTHELHEEKDRERPYSFQHLFFLIGWGIVISVLYGWLMYSRSFLYYDAEGNETLALGCCYLMYALSLVGMLSSCVFLFRNHRPLKHNGFGLLLSYVVLPFLTLESDLKNAHCYSYLMMSFFVFILYIENDLRRNNLILEQEAQLVNLQSKIMLSQMKPHFLFNTLSTISVLCYLEEAPRAKEVVDKFADYLRGNMSSMGKHNFIPFEKELEHIKTYLWIEKVRFEEALTVEYRIGPKDFFLPSMTIQPLVENAVKHGICGKKGGGTVIIETREDEREYTVIIRDDGAGFDPAQKPADGKSHVGIENITERLRILQASHLDIESQIGQGTTVTVHLPKERENT